MINSLTVHARVRQGLLQVPDNATSAMRQRRYGHVKLLSNESALQPAPSAASVREESKEGYIL